MSPEALAPLAFALGAALGGVGVWAAMAPSPLRFPPPPEPPAPPPPPPEPPRGLSLTSADVLGRFAPRCRAAAEGLAQAAFAEAGIDPQQAALQAEGSASAALGEAMLLDLVQAGWVDGASQLAAAVRTSSPLPPAVTMRLLDIAHRAALDPSPPEPAPHA